MTLTQPTARPAEGRTPSPRRILMCRPERFTVRYSINPWMHPDRPTDTERALAQWRTLVEAYEQLGFEIEYIEPLEHTPDMVYAANGGFVLDGIAYGAKFAHPERADEGPAYLERLGELGYRMHAAVETNEGEGDFLLVGDAILAGHGFRSDASSHDEIAELFGREVVPLRLVDPSFYHLDTALAVLDPTPGREHIAYLPSAFDEASRTVLAERYPDAIIVAEEDAAVFGLNAFGNGRDIVIAAQATGFAAQLEAAGYRPIGVDLSELLLGGGGVKCCTLELR
ncbi:dimethylargininase [Agromyces seonyuensis]|uniref:N-dimethylarginine dimethylaminohydrolase n=1 Tax=Agromyces seonyuensis TaxID=2662446 RepID=A0A6I4P3N6_9MICO|nr:dimethylargininase [Agromyces seonyuensis]MWB97957.1 N-dimethylarginine dimethylaminohydrolase [Agromyces seonyuensis]